MAIGKAAIWFPSMAIGLSTMPTLVGLAQPAAAEYKPCLPLTYNYQPCIHEVRLPGT